MEEYIILFLCNQFTLTIRGYLKSTRRYRPEKEIGIMRTDNDKGSKRVAIGKRIRQEREKRRMTREELADRVDITPRFLADIEAGTKGMSIDTLNGISSALEVSLDHIVNGENSRFTAKSSQIRDIHQAMEILFRGLNERGFHFLEDVYPYTPGPESGKKDGEEEHRDEDEDEKKRTEG